MFWLKHALLYATFCRYINVRILLPLHHSFLCFQHAQRLEPSSEKKFFLLSLFILTATFQRDCIDLISRYMVAFSNFSNSCYVGDITGFYTTLNYFFIIYGFFEKNIMLQIMSQNNLSYKLVSYSWHPPFKATEPLWGESLLFCPHEFLKLIWSTFKWSKA